MRRRARADAVTASGWVLRGERKKTLHLGENVSMCRNCALREESAPQRRFCVGNICSEILALLLLAPSKRG